MKYENREKWKLKSLISWIGTFEYIMLQKKGYTDSLLFAEHGENMLCTKIVLNVRNYFCTQHVLSRFELGVFMYWMNNLSSYCGLVDAKIKASDKDLPVKAFIFDQYIFFLKQIYKHQYFACASVLFIKREAFVTLRWKDIACQ